MAATMRKRNLSRIVTVHTKTRKPHKMGIPKLYKLQTQYKGKNQETHKKL